MLSWATRTVTPDTAPDQILSASCPPQTQRYFEFGLLKPLMQNLVWFNKPQVCLLGFQDHRFQKLEIKRQSVHKQNEIMSFASTWMDLEIVILSEVSQTEKDRYHIIQLICGILKKKKRYKWTYLQNRNRVKDVENKFMVTKGVWCGGGINWEIGINIYALLYVKQITNKDLLYSTGNSTQYSVMTHMGKESKKGWIYVKTKTKKKTTLSFAYFHPSYLYMSSYLSFNGSTYK